MTQDRIIYLLEKHLAQQATAAETEEFWRMVQNAEEDSAVREVLLATWLQFNTEEQLLPQQADALFNTIINEAEGLHRKPAKLVRMKTWTRMAAAAVIIMMLGVGGYLYMNYNVNNPTGKVNPARVADVAAPTSANAVLTLANGQQIELNKADTGSIAQQGSARVIKQADGEIIYHSPLTIDHSPIAYNTLVVPRGSKVVNIVLSDGTKVWLNSASSLRYPASFTGNERTVEMTGEVYFEVTPLTPKGESRKAPFIVKIGSPSGNGGEVEVLGTHFNINAYDDEPVVKTTLLEGKVKISSMVNGEWSILKPGEQAVAGNHSPLTIDHSPDVEAVMAWKNGRFEFSGNTIEPIMKQVARWYDVEVEYRGAVPTDNFMGGTSRQANVSELLKILEQTKAIRFQIEGKKIIVSKP
jgi:ferric-dicitrate binding protein FerR (iron transport regulator)